MVVVRDGKEKTLFVVLREMKAAVAEGQAGQAPGAPADEGGPRRPGDRARRADRRLQRRRPPPVLRHLLPRRPQGRRGPLRRSRLPVAGRLQPGDVILSVEHKDVRSAKEAVAAAKTVDGAKEGLLLLVWQRGVSLLPRHQDRLTHPQSQQKPQPHTPCPPPSPARATSPPARRTRSSSRSRRTAWTSSTTSTATPHTGFASITEDDFTRFKWYGFYRQKPKDSGYFMLRMRLPGGQLDSRQLDAVAAISDDFAHGFCDVTTRQTFQFHWLTIEQAPEIMAPAGGGRPHLVRRLRRHGAQRRRLPRGRIVKDEILDATPRSSARSTSTCSTTASSPTCPGSTRSPSPVAGSTAPSRTSTACPSSAWSGPSAGSWRRATG